MSMCVCAAFFILLDEALWQQLVKITRHHTNIPFLSLSLSLFLKQTHTPLLHTATLTVLLYNGLANYQKESLLLKANLHFPSTALI